MTWILYRWTWRVASPLFVGATPSGALNRCRVYVPARPFWGAITAELARLQGDKDPKYQQVGEDLRKDARFSYLFPAQRIGDEWRAWLPEYREGAGLVWAREGGEAVLPDRNLRRQLLGARPATAVDPDSDSALDGSLRETECVQTWWRRSDGSARNDPVALVGYVFIRKDRDEFVTRLSAIDRLFIGGDTRYGLGRLDHVAKMRQATTVFGEAVDLAQPNPHVIANRVFAHVPFRDDLPMCGEQEALGGWDMTGRQQDRRVSGPAWTPGSRSLEEGSRNWAIVESGMAHLAEGSP